MKYIAPVRRFLREEVVSYIRMPNKKSLLTQVSELIMLWKYYDYIPYHYIKHQLYERDSLDILSYVPPKFFERLQVEDNSPSQLPIVRDKILFQRHMEAHGVRCIDRSWWVDRSGRPHDDEGPIMPDQLIEAVSALAVQRLFAKRRVGSQGRDARVIAVSELAEILPTLRDVILQPLVEQHAQLAVLYPGALNTIRLDSLIIEEDVIHSVAALRMGVGEMFLDNWDRGGIVVGVDVETGRLHAIGRRKNKYLDPRNYDRHPDTGTVFAGYQLPYWPEVRGLVQRAARSLPGLRTLCWDVAIDASGPLVVEANDLWSVNMLQQAWGGMRDTPLGRRAMQRHGLNRNS